MFANKDLEKKISRMDVSSEQQNEVQVWGLNAFLPSEK